MGDGRMNAKPGRFVETPDQWHGPQTVPQRQPQLFSSSSRSGLEDTVRFVADLGKRARRRHQRIRDKL